MSFFLEMAINQHYVTPEDHQKVCLVQNIIASHTLILKSLLNDVKRATRHVLFCRTIVFNHNPNFLLRIAKIFKYNITGFSYDGSVDIKLMSHICQEYNSDDQFRRNCK